MAGTMSVSGRVRSISGINITPLVDVVLVLLVVLMVASTYIVAQTLKVNLPKAHTSDGTAEKPNTVQLFKSGEMRWNEQPVSKAELEGRMRGAIAAEPEMSLVVSADRDALHGNVVEIMDMAKRAGITKFAINIMQAGGE